MSDSNQVQVHPLAALSVATRQNHFDHNEKMLLSGDIHTLQMAVQERDEKIKALQAELATYAQFTSEAH